MKKFFTLMLAIVAVMTVNAKQVVFDFTNPEALGITAPETGKGTPINDSVIVVDGVAMTNHKVASTDTRIWNANGAYDLRIYANSTLTFKAEENINAVVFAGSAIGFNEMTGSAWLGDADSVTFTANMTNRINTVTLYIGEQPEVWIPDTVSVTEARALIDSADVHDHFVIGVVAGTPFSTGTWGGKICFWMTDGQNAADSLEAFQVFAKNNAKWNSLDEAKEELQKGDTVLVYAQKLELYAAKNFYEINGGYYVEKLGAAPVAPITGDTISVAEAIAIADTLPANKNSEENYFVEGYAVNVEAYSTQYNNQMFFLVDDAAQPDSLFKAYRATPKKDGKPYPVLAGDKLRLYGQLQKYVKDSVAQLEIMDATVEFLEEVEGDRTIEEPTEQLDTITVARALEIGKALSSGSVSSDKYVIDGYVSSIIDGYSEQYGNETFWITDEKGSRAASTAAGAFEIYRCKPSTNAEIGLDAKIRIACKIKNYNGTIENDGVNLVFEVLEQGHEETFDTISVERALEIGYALEDNGQTPVKYVIEGYVSSVESPFDAQYKNETFWMTGEKGSHAATNDEGAFYVYRGTPTPAEEIGWNARIFVTSVIKKYMKGGKPIIETNGKVDVNVVEPGEEEKFDTISVAEALTLGYALEDNAKTGTYVISGYVSSIESYFDSKYGNETFWLADEPGTTAATNVDGAFYVYRAKPDSAREIGWNAKVFVKTTIYSYVKTSVARECTDPVIETGTSNAPVTVVKYGEEEVIDTITVAQALEIGLGLAPKAATPNRYVITGYVSAIDDPYSESYGNETFWITDEKGSRAASSADGAFEVYRGKPDSGKEIGLDAKIRILCKIKNYSPTIENDGMGIVFEVLETGTPLQIDTISVERALEIGMALADNAYSKDLYVVRGYAVKAYDPDSCKTAQNIYMADYLEDYGEFYGYNVSADSKIETNDYLILRGKIQKYVKGDNVTIELSYGSATHVTAPTIDTIRVEVKEAVEIGMKLAPAAKTPEYYLVTGFVAKVTGEFDDEELNESFWMNDEKYTDDCLFYANLARIADPGVAQYQKVSVFGRIQRYEDEEGETIIRIDKGVATLINDEGIENVVLTEQATKVFVDGVLYIIRDNKMYNIQGAQVR